MMKKIVILNDFIRDCLGFDSSAEDVANATKNLLYYQLNKATNLEVETIFECIDVKKFMQLNNISDYTHLEKESVWAYYCNNISKEAEEYLVNYLKDTIVIGYHLTNLMSDVLERNNISFIDTFETSYRYMQDSYLGFRTNIGSAKKYLLENSLSTNSMYVYANYLKAFYRKKQYYKLDENSCLLVGQTSRDSVLIKKDNTFTSLQEYKDIILSMSKKYKTLYYKMHPLEPLNSEIIDILHSIPNAYEETHNFYELMAQEGIKEVFGLNSGSISEAKFFGKKTTFLFSKYHAYYQDEGDINDYGTFIIINSNSHIFKINFWAELLSDIISTYKISEKEDVSFDNYQSLYSNYINLSSSYELGIFNYDINKKIQDHSNGIKNLEFVLEEGFQTKVKDYVNKMKFLENKINQQEERINYYEYLLKKNSNKYKKLFLNIILGFIPLKSTRKSLRDKYIKY